MSLGTAARTAGPGWLGRLADEGWRALADRLVDRALDRRDRARHQPADDASNVPQVAVLGLLETPPERRLGGVQIAAIQRHRHAGETGRALLFPYGDRYRLEVGRGGHELALAGPPITRPPAGPAPFPACADPALADALAWAADRVGASVLHVENLGTLPPRTLAAVAERGLAVVVSLHDFGAFCPRPHLLELPAGRFCHYSRDAERCLRCLSVDHRVARDDQSSRREAVAELLAAATALVFPSEFQRRTVGRLFPGLEPGRLFVVEPGLDLPPVKRRAPDGVQRVAFVGGTRLHKGGGLVAPVMEACRRSGAAPPEWWVLGGGEAEVARALRGLPGVHLRGYYRAGSLPRLLAARGVDVAVLPSIVPESFGLTLTECWHAGCPVVAFDHGAVGERLRGGGGGAVVAPERGAAGLAEAIGTALGRATRAAVPPAAPSAAAAARAHQRLFARISG